MKNSKLTSLLVFMIAAMSFVSCNDVEPIDPTIVLNPSDPTNPTNPTNPTGGNFKVDIDGLTYTASATAVFISGGSIQIAAERAQGDTFGVLLDGTTAGTYQAHENLIAYSPAGSEYGYWGVNPNTPDAQTGSIIITNIDTVNKKISGTFSYIGYWSDLDATGIAPKSFTNGVFTNLPYVTESPSNDTFLAKVNGVDFNQNDLLAMTIGAGTDEFIAIGASNAAGDEMTVAVRSTVGLGTHPITGNSLDNAQLSYGPAGSTGQTSAASGSVTIQEKSDTHIKGIFSGAVTVDGTTYNITAGSFDVEY